MKIVLLGTGGYHPSEARHTACMMLPEAGIILDAGSAMFRVPEQLQTSELDILLSHGHLDHVEGLTYILDVRNQHPLDRITVHAERDRIESISTHLFSQLLFPVEPPFEFAELEGEFTAGDNCRVTWFPMKHPGGSVGFRLDWTDRSMAYVTDTTAHADADYVQHIRGVDLLVHECYFNDGQEELAELTGHSCATPVGQVAQKAGVGKLVLVHVNPIAPIDNPLELDPIRQQFSKPVLLATDGMELEF